MEVAFRARGHEVEAVSHGLGVIGRLAGWEAPSPDVCVLDNYLPEITGMAIVNLAARTRGAAEVPVLIYSSDHMVEEQVRSSPHRVVHFMVKGRLSDLVRRTEEVGTFACRRSAGTSGS